MVHVSTRHRKSSVSVEFWKSIFDVVAVFAAAITFIAGAGALWTGNILNKRQVAHLRQFDKDLTAAKIDLAKQQQRAAELDADNLDVRRVMDMRRRIGGTDPTQIVSRLTSIIEMQDIRVWFQSPSDSEPGVLLGEIRGWVTRARWGGIYDGIFE
jgi:hypothetical protein